MCVLRLLRYDTMSCLPIVSDSCDRREQVFRVGAAAPRVFNSKYLFLFLRYKLSKRKIE